MWLDESVAHGPDLPQLGTERMRGVVHDSFPLPSHLFLCHCLHTVQLHSTTELAFLTSSPFFFGSFSNLQLKAYTWWIFYGQSPIFSAQQILNLTTVRPTKINEEFNISLPKFYSRQHTEGFQISFRNSNWHNLTGMWTNDIKKNRVELGWLGLMTSICVKFWPWLW